MDFTTMHVEVSSTRIVVVTFKRKGRGAPLWQRYVDTFERIVEEVRKGHRQRVKRPDGKQSLGRGARMLMTAPVFLDVLRSLKQDEETASGFAIRDFRIKFHGAAKGVLREELQRRACAASSSRRPLLPSETESTDETLMGGTP